MNQEKLLYFKGLLEGRLRVLLEEAGKTMTDMVEDKKEGFPDPTDRASLESDRNFLIANTLWNRCHLCQPVFYLLRPPWIESSRAQGCFKDRRSHFA